MNNNKMYEDVYFWQEWPADALRTNGNTISFRKFCTLEISL